MKVKKDSKFEEMNVTEVENKLEDEENPEDDYHQFSNSLA